MSRRWSAGATVIALVTLAVFGFAGTAAADRSCAGTIGAERIDDNVHVPDGASCTLEGTVVHGNVLVGRGATLAATGITVDGNIQDDDNAAGDVRISGSRVEGNIQLERGAGAAITDTAIDGDLQMDSNSGALRAEGNDMGGNLQANGNTGGLVVVGNTIDGNLQCQGNDPAPTGGRNVVRGSAEGQCARLAGGNGPTEPPTGPSRQTSRLAGEDRFATAVQISQTAFPHGAPVAYLARADQFADALAASSLTDGPVLLVPGCGEVPAVVLQEIRRLDPQRVVALGGPAAVCEAVLSAAAGA